MYDGHVKLLLQPNGEGCKISDKSSVFLAVRRFLGVPYRHQGRGGDGLDCLGLLLAVAKILQLRDAQGAWLAEGDRWDYGWRPDGVAFEAELAQRMRPAETPQAGDVALFRLQGNPQHVGILSDLPDGRRGLIHAHAPAGRVVEHGFDGPWPRRLHAVFSL